MKPSDKLNPECRRLFEAFFPDGLVAPRNRPEPYRGPGSCSGIFSTPPCTCARDMASDPLGRIHRCAKCWRSVRPEPARSVELLGIKQKG